MHVHKHLDTNIYTVDINIYPPHTYRPHSTIYASPKPILYVAGAVEDSDQSRMQQHSDQSRIKVTNPQISDLYEKIHNLESLMTKTHSLLEKVLKQQQHGVPFKPAFLPISMLAGMTEFQNIDDNGYRETQAVVQLRRGAEEDVDLKENYFEFCFE